MKKYILNAIAIFTFATGLSSCGDSFLETDNYKGVDLEGGLNTVTNVSTALNGTYYQLFYYAFAGNYALAIGDIPTDITYWNTKTGHFDGIYTYTFTDTDTYLKSIWEYGYKTADNAARVIQASQALYNNASDDEKTELNMYMAEAYALRGYAQLLLTNIYGHQIKVNGQDFSSELGIVIIDQPKEALTKISRSTVGESYEAIINDLKNALSHFEAAGKDRGELQYLGKAATNGLLARTYLYLENWDEARNYAEQALKIAGITTLTNDANAYKALYNSEISNSESMFALAITNTTNWSANSYGTLWSMLNAAQDTPTSGKKKATAATAVSSMYWGESSAMQQLRMLVEKVAVTDANILITGENGTGKEMLAREIHALSTRHHKEMISVDMGAITESLFESELFGHMKGSFTDAHADRPGKFESADHSTLFLDEIGNLPYHLQAKLLTALQRRSIVRVGSNTPIPIDIRLVCATNRHLSEMADKGEFREDLLYRINTIHLEIPALRERPEDIIPLAERFITRFCKQYGKPALRLDNSAREKLTLHPWFGNIRELEHAIEKAVIICDGTFLSAGSFQLQRRNEAPETPVSTLEDMEKQMIRQTLEKCGSNLSAVASQLGITRQTLYNKMKKYGL